MNTKTAFSIIILTVLLSINLSAQTGVEKRIVATLGPGEILAYDEDCFILDQNPEQISFVTFITKGSEKEYYCYGKDGKKTGQKDGKTRVLRPRPG